MEYWSRNRRCHGRMLVARGHDHKVCNVNFYVMVECEISTVFLLFCVFFLHCAYCRSLTSGYDLCGWKLGTSAAGVSREQTEWPGDMAGSSMRSPIVISDDETPSKASTAGYWETSTGTLSVVSSFTACCSSFISIVLQ